MPLIFEKTLPHSRLGVWEIKETEEELRSASRVVPGDLEVLASWKNESRRKQWLACRVLLSNLLQPESVKIDYSEHGKPSLNGFPGHISFSHTTEYAAVMVDEKACCGIDIELIRPRILRVENRFLQDEELEEINEMERTGKREPVIGRCERNVHDDHGAGLGKHQSAEDNRVDGPAALVGPDSRNPGNCDPHTELLYIYWCSKEALYKLYGNLSLDLKNDIRIVSFDYFCRSQATFAARVNLTEGVKYHELQFERIGDHMLVYTLSEQE